ncbi:Snf7-domain-containing protein [Annulohypoxylon stygium]|nr:Snf7-domain-containing protein [Annulohypoxylon stygium]
MLAAGDKKRALLALRRKKYQESLLEKTDAQLAQLEQLTRSVEFALIQKDVVFGLQQGTKVLKEIHAEMGGVEHVEKLMGETADAIAYQKARASIYLPAYLIYCFTTSYSISYLLLLAPAVRSAILTHVRSQEVSEMLGGRITNQDEDEVEDELAALELEVNGPAPLPNVPNTKLPKIDIAQQQAAAPQEPEPEQERRAMLAA